MTRIIEQTRAFLQRRFHGNESGSHSGEGETEAYLSAQRGQVSYWMIIIRMTLAVGMFMYLVIDAIAVSFQAVPGTVVVLGAYIAVNGALWYMMSSRARHLPWCFAVSDVFVVVFVLTSLPPAVLPDTPFSLAALLALLLMCYASYANPSLTAVVSIASLAITAWILYGPVAGLPFISAVTAPIQGFLVLQYLSIACVVTCLLSLVMRRQIIAYGQQIERRRIAAVNAAAERARREEAERLDRLKQDFIDVLSHELRSPLAPLRSSLELVQADFQQGRYDEEMLTVALRSAASLEELVDHYTQLAELLTSDQEATTPYNIEIDSLIADILSELHLKNVENRSLRNLTACADPLLLHGTLRAILQRAASHTSEPNLITIRGQETPDHSLIHINDPTSYLSPTDISSLRDPFSPISERIYFSKNTGLELILAEHGLEKLGGRMAVTSSKEKGTTVTCYLPTRDENAQWIDIEELHTLYRQMPEFTAL